MFDAPPDLDLPPFRCRFPWVSGDLQTLATRLYPGQVGAPTGTGERIEVPMTDGSGDRLLGVLDEPVEPRRLPLLLLVHGLTGCETSSYMLTSARHFLELGYRVLRLNLRGAGPSRASCGGQYHAGGSADLRLALRLLPPRLIQDGVLAIGFSLGGGILLKYLGEVGIGSPLLGAATVCAPVDLDFTSRYLMRPRTRLYHNYFLANMKREATGDGARLTDDEREIIRRARNVREFDGGFIAPRHGYGGVEPYYADNSALGYACGIAVPTLCIAASDDPCVPASTYEPFCRAATRGVRVTVTQGGGHVGFHDASGTVPWHDRAIAHFFERLA